MDFNSASHKTQPVVCGTIAMATSDSRKWRVRIKFHAN
jgi:hypothetical protein